MAIPLIIKRIAIFLGYDVGVQEGNIRKTMAARGLVEATEKLYERHYLVIKIVSSFFACLIKFLYL